MKTQNNVTNDNCGILKIKKPRYRGFFKNIISDVPSRMFEFFRWDLINH